MSFPKWMALGSAVCCMSLAFHGSLSIAQARPVVLAPVATATNPFPGHYSTDGDLIQPHDSRSSAYIPVDSWIYPALLRLYGMGYLDTAFLGMRPWTRRSVLHMLEQTESDIRFDENEEALDILAKVERALADEPDPYATYVRGTRYGVDEAYGGIRYISGDILRDSFHLGQTFFNDYGRPYSPGANSYDGISARVESGRFSLQVRGEYQHAPTWTGYNFALANALSTLDTIPYSGFNRPQSTIPEGPLPTQDNFRILEANFAVHAAGHEISFGKSDAWLGPGLGGAMAWSNNAENIYSFRINRVEPLNIPLLHRLVGPVRYDFFVGSLKGHTSPNDPWVHSEMFAFAPSRDFQFGFQRTVVWGGKGHVPITVHSFLRSFFSTAGVDPSIKFSREDPGARFGAFYFSYRLPFLRRIATLYTDSIAHDDVTPLSAPRRGAFRPGIYLSHVPGVPKLDFRAEATYTDFVTSRSIAGQGNYDENVQVQGYTNKSYIFGDWIGREGKGGQGWLTYHLSGNDWVSLEYLRKKNAKDFIAGGTTQDQIKLEAVKRFRNDYEVTAAYQHEWFQAPIYLPGARSSDTGTIQIKWYPRLRTTPFGF